MKLPIKKNFFDLIKSGKKNVELRDAHITFICEETGETLRKEITSVYITTKYITTKDLYDDWDPIKMTLKEYREMFTDENIIVFKLK